MTMQDKKAAVLFSGGKDSCLALFKAKQQGFDVKYLLAILPPEDAMMWHKPNLKLLEMQAKMLGIQLITHRTEKEEKGLEELLKKVKGKIDTIVIGGIASNYQGKRIKKVCKELGLEIFAPLWSYSADKLWQELLENKFEVIIIKTACEGIPKGFLGTIIDNKILDKLKILAAKYKFDLSFEGGDAETAVLCSPDFRKEIKAKGKIVSESEYRHFFKIEKLAC